MMHDLLSFEKFQLLLYVEDDPQDADLTRRYLAENAPHFDVDIVETQPEAESLLAENEYDLVLADLKLPQGDGIGLLVHIREQNIPLPVVMISGRGDEGSVVAALHAGADDYVLKRADYLTRLPQTLEDARQRYHEISARREHIIRVLYAEHDPADVDLTRRHLAQYAPHIQVDTVKLGEAVLQNLAGEAHNYDILLLDYRLPGVNALEVLKELRQIHRLAIPVVLTTGHGDEQTALQSLKLGAYDYIVKSEGYLLRLPAVLENAVYQSRLAAEEARYQDLFETVPVGLYRTSIAGQFLIGNPALIAMLGYPSMEALQAANVLDTFVNPADRQSLLQELERHGTVVGLAVELIRQDGSPVWAEMDITLIKNHLGEPFYLQGMMKDITERVKAEAERQHLHEQVIKDANELEKRVQQRTEQYQTIINLTAGREIRMAELKKVIKKLRAQLIEMGEEPVADDPLALGIE